MGWTMTPVKAPASAVKVPLSEIPADVQESVEEAFTYCQENPTDRLVIAFETEDAADQNKALIRSYCEARTAGRLTASIWSGFAEMGENGAEKFVALKTEKATAPALSLFLRMYVKREKGAENGQPAPATASAPPGGVQTG